MELRRYILGLANEAEAEQIEERLMIDEEICQEFEIVETEIIQDFVDEKLNSEERTAFEKNFIITKERSEQITFARTLRKFVDEKKIGDSIEKISFFDSLKTFFLSPVPAICAALLISGVIGFFVWQNYNKQSDILLALNSYQKNERPTEARITDFSYAPKIEGTRGNNDTQTNLNLELARSLALQAVQKNRNAENLHALGQVLLAEKKYDDAIKNFEESIKLNSNIAKLHNDLGVALLEKSKQKEEGQLELSAKANEEFAKAIELDKTSLEAHFNQALAIESLTLTNQAKEAWQNYLKLDPTSKWADEARERLKKLEENKSISKTKEEILRDFLTAKEANDTEKAWQILSRNRGLSSGKLIPQQLAFLFIDSKFAGDEIKAKEILDSLSYIGKLEAERSGDLFWRDLANYYQIVSADKIPKLKQAKDQYYQTILTNEATIKIGNYKGAITELELVKNLYLEVANNTEPKLIQFLIGYLLNREAKIKESNEKLIALGDFCRKAKYKWLELQTITWVAANDVSERKLSKGNLINKRALELSVETQDILSLQKNFAQFAEAYFLMGEFEKALLNTQKNLEIGSLPEASLNERWRALNAISRYLNKLKIRNSTILFEKEALILAQQLGDKTFEFTSLVDLAVTYSTLLNDFENALGLIEEGRQISEGFPDGDYKNKCLAHINLQLGHINRQKGLYQEAINNYRNATDYYDSGSFQVYSYEAHRGILISSLADKNDSVFQNELPKILEIFKVYRQEIIEEQSRNSFFDNEQDVYDIVAEYEFNKGNYERAFDYAEESRSRSLLDLQHSVAEVSTNENLPQIKLSANLAEPLKLASIQAEMPENTQLLVYSMLPDKVLIWLIAKNSLNTAKTEILSENLQEKVINYVNLVSQNSLPNEQTNLSKELYQILILPVKDKLDSSKQLFIIPDKVLFRLPFATLYSDKYLVEEFNISYSPSANVFLNCSKNAEKLGGNTTEKLLSIGNPTFNQDNYENELSTLPSAKAEANEIAKLYEKPTILVENEATKERVKESLRNADVLHFAGHYVIDEKTPLLSSLVLAGDQESNLANHEIFTEKLSHIRLIVLSACDTGIERYYRGEGMIGASRTFLAKNIPIVVASQWSIDSAATKDLMIRFHKLRKTENISTAQALRQAQLEMLKNEKFKEPYYWAAFATLGGYTQF